MPEVQTEQLLGCGDAHVKYTYEPFSEQRYRQASLATI
jgi:hypothetical protein